MTELKTRPDTSDMKTIIEVIEKRDYERKYFKPEAGEVWADLGGCIGAFSACYAPVVKKIYVYEPSPASFALLSDNVAQFDNVFPIQLAVSNKADEISFFERPKQNWRNSTRKLFKDSVETKVACISAADLPKDVTAVKIDVEGSELEILETLNLSQLNKLVMEWSFDFLPEVKHYNNAIALLQQHFDVVKFQNVKAEIWQKNWFPPCKKVFAYNEPKIQKGESK